MNATTHAVENGTDYDDLDKRSVKALTEYLLVVEEAPDLYHVYGEDGDEYAVDARSGACTCPDFEYRQPAGGCKHVRRVAFRTGEREIPEWADREAFDPLLREHVKDGQPVATDGGQVEESEKIDEFAREGDCEVCEDTGTVGEVPCFVCVIPGESA